MKKIVNFFSVFWNGWSVGLILLFAVFLLCNILLFTKKFRKIKFLKPTRVWILTIVVCVSFMVAPVYYKDYGAPSILISVHHAFRLFVMDGGVADVLGEMAAMADKSSFYQVTTFTKNTYSVIGGFLFILAPAVTASFILSFFKNFKARLRYLLSFRKHIHLFAELNEESLALATSIFNSEKGGNPQIVFADIRDKGEDNYLDLMDSAEKLGAIFLQKDLLSIKLSKREHSIYLINDDENEKIKHAKSIIYNKKYAGDEKKKLYIFSDSEECKCFMDSFSDEAKNEIKMQIECIDNIRFLIYHYLDEHGVELFENTKKGSKYQEISVAVVGFGKYGIELVKALLWYCQIPGFKIRITVFDKDAKAKSKVQAMFPGITLDAEMDDEEDMKYALRVVQDVEVGTMEFKNKFHESMRDVNHVFVFLGSDAENLWASASIRQYLEQNDCHSPKISTVIYNTALCENVNIRHAGKDSKSKMESLDIYAFGDIASFYSEGTIINSDTVKDGFTIHKAWGEENTYYMDDYNFYSSIAKVLHYRLRNKIIQRGSLQEEYKRVFPQIFDETDGQTNWVHFIIERTTSAEKAADLKVKYAKLLEGLPQLDQTEKIGELLYEERKQEVVPPSLVDDLPITTVFDVLMIAKTAASIDHVRWNAYMRSEGFVKGDKCTAYRKHQDLRPVNELKLADCIKDI